MTYNIRYYIIVGISVIGVITGGISGYQHFTQTAPSWLTPDVGGTCAIVAGICGGIAALLSQTPAGHAAALIRAKAGMLPNWVTRKYLIHSTGDQS